MANITFYKYLEQAFRYKIKHPEAKEFKYLNYNLPYESSGPLKGIFYQARKLLPSFYRDPIEFPNNEKGDLHLAEVVINKLDRKQDPELENQFKGVNPSEEHTEIFKEAEADSEAHSQAEQAHVGEPVGAMAGSQEHPAKPQYPSQPNIPQFNTPFANKPPSYQGAATEKANRLASEQQTGTGTAATQKSLNLENTNQKSPAIDKAERLNKTSEALKAGPATQKAQSFQPPTKPTISTSSGLPKTPSITTNPGLKYKTGFGNTLKNLTSSSGKFFQRNLGKYLTVGRAAAGAGALVGGITGAGLTGGSPLGIAGGALGGGILPSWIKSGGGGRFFSNAGNGAINSFTRLTTPTRGSSIAKGLFGKNTQRKVLLLFLGFFMGFGLIAGLLGGAGQGSTTPSGNVGVGTPGSPAVPAPVGPVTHPVPPTVNPSELRQKIIDTFGVTMNGYSEQHLQYAWDKFWDVSGTNFRNYIKGVTVTNEPNSRKNGCSNLIVQALPEDLFKLILVHEFGHIIQDCKKILLEAHADAYTREGGITYYARNAVACGSYYNIQEDYAEMIAYYLNPTTNASTARCTPAGFTNPNIKQNFPLHYNVVRGIIGDF